MKLVYVAGPYRSPRGINGIQENINRARNVGRHLWSLGFAVITPHCNTAMMDGIDIPESAWLNGDLVMLERCDALVVLPGWERSEGTRGEILHARNRGIQTFYWPQDEDKIKELSEDSRKAA